MIEIKSYESRDESLKKWIEEIVSSDPYGLSPKTLYDNIYYSTGDDRQLSQIFEVPVGLIRAIKK